MKVIVRTISGVQGRDPRDPPHHLETAWKAGLGATSALHHRPGTARVRPERTSVEAPPEHHGDDSKPSPELAAVRK